MTDIPLRYVAGFEAYTKTNLSHPSGRFDFFKRAWGQVVSSLGKQAAVEGLDLLFGKHSIQEILPLWGEWQQQLATAEQFTNSASYRLHISFSSPVSYPRRLSLSSLLKLFTPEGKQFAKIKIACFSDTEDRLWWEVGFVYLSKSLELDNDFARAEKHSYFFLSRLVSNCYSFLRTRPFIAGINMSPAYYHVLPVSQHIASQYPGHYTGSLSPEWEKSSHQAFLNYCMNHKIQRAKTASQNRFLISRLLQQKKLIHPVTGEVMEWSPPSILIFNRHGRNEFY